MFCLGWPDGWLWIVCAFGVQSVCKAVVEWQNTALHFSFSFPLLPVIKSIERLKLTRLPLPESKNLFETNEYFTLNCLPFSIILHARLLC